MFLEKLPLVHVETEMDAKAVVRRMRLHQKAPAAPEKTEMDVAGFNELVQAAKSDLMQQESAAKNELEFYRGLLDIKKPRPAIDLSGGASSFKLPSLKPPPKQPPTNQERPTSSSSTTSSNGRGSAPRKLATEGPKATLAAIKPKPSTLKGPLAMKPPQARLPRPSDEPKASAKGASHKPTPVPAAGPAKRPQPKTSAVAPPPKPNNTPIATTKKVVGRSKKEVSTMDCLATFDDAEPEVDSAPVYSDFDSNNNGYGSDDDNILML
ncbi:hypothetical protein SDRG_06752 [Saprolegnia diclina VS20]|uniref:Uncharacterized protein n=1 Tax=Saprolegnia diclina (strain VS20) TaxID=1156394 RepID=T0QDS0_SAPDV|nr:hypothetical protein SDRG_06752 [Saprolegnia diclina VS20]EQC36014.1 hypothetical protein SDRG_06752 [Saprolegnia diclina VS20]|eukprot:XP_008610776.1 hypothetical protein SDRG_06752 [Saprolegnia diclina VS20]